MLRFSFSASLAWIFVASHVAQASVIIIIDNPPPPTVPDVKTRVQAIDVKTGGVAFSHIIDGTLQSASLSDRDEAAYSVAEPGSSLFNPQTSLFVQKIKTAPSSALFTHNGPMWNVGITDSRLVWQDFESIKLRSRTDGTTQTYGGSGSSHVQISGNRLLWSTWSSLGSHQYSVTLVNLDTDNYTELFRERSIAALALPRHVPGIDSGAPISIVYSPLAVSGGRVYSDSPFSLGSGGTQVPLYDDSGLPFDVRSLKTNGEQMAFTSVQQKQIDESTYTFESTLYLRHGSDILKLSGPEPSEYALGPDAVAWSETAGGVESLFVHDITSGQKRSLPTRAAEFQVWDMNGQYVLVSSEVPEPASWVLLVFAAAGGSRRR